MHRGCPRNPERQSNSPFSPSAHARLHEPLPEQSRSLGDHDSKSEGKPVTTVLMPTPGWKVLAQRFGTGLEDREPELWRLSGLDEEYGPPGDGFTGTRAAKEM